MQVWYLRLGHLNYPMWVRLSRDMLELNGLKVEDTPPFEALTEAGFDLIEDKEVL